MQLIKIAATGAFLYASIYLAGCFASGLFFGVPLAWKAALASAGLGYLAQLAEANRLAGALPEKPVLALMIASALAGLAAGLSLLIGA